MCKKKAFTTKISHSFILWAVLSSIHEVGGFLFSASKCSENMIDGRIRTDCSRKNLVNIFGMHLHSATRLLDLSDNEFVRIQENQFKDEQLTNLEEIVLRNNHIQRIDGLAFNALHMLYYLDLSKNQITSLALDFMPPLRVLNLSYNALSPDFTFYCSTLLVLDLSFCNIPVVPVMHYSDLPRLEHLNISYNKIKKLPMAVLQHMPLRSIQFSRNPISCGDETTKLITWFEKQRIQYSPICFGSPPMVYSKDETILPTRVIKPLSLPADYLPNEHITDHQCLNQLKSIRNEQRFFAILTLTVHFAILIVVLIFFGLFLSYRFKDEKRARVTIEEGDQEAPPPPYRSRTYVPGFSI